MAKSGLIIKRCFCVFLWMIVISVCMPAVTPNLRARNIRDLSNAKEIYLALRLYAGDHDGRFPSSLPDGSPVITANQAYRALIPEYLRKETIFFIKGSAWTSKEPDNDFLGDRKLAEGENAFAYVSNLTDVSNPLLPLVADGFIEGTPGIYSLDPKRKGGIPKGCGVIVVRVDGSGKIERLEKSGVIIDRIDGTAMSERVGKRDIDLFKPAPGWLAPNQVPLNPE